MNNKKRLQSQITDLQNQWELVSQKISQLEREKILETRSDERFRLEHRISDVKNEREQLEQHLFTLEKQLRHVRGKRAHDVSDSSESPTLQIYHNLPQPDYEKFIGRKAELGQIYELLSPQHRSWAITLDGIGGIGKSTLALEVAEYYRRHYDEIPQKERFDAIIWTTAKQTMLTAEGILIRPQAFRTLNDIYTTIAITLQREDITHSTADERGKLIRQVLTQQRILLIIDNLETVDDEQVLTFIRELPVPTKVIVTTRHRIDVAYPVRLAALPEDDALQLIYDTTQRKGVELTTIESERLYRRTGGIPLAIVWSIAQMGFGYGVEAVLSRLGQPTSDISRFCFEGAMERIKKKPAHDLLMTCSLCADSASREALGYATKLPELDRDDGLVELEKLSLVNKYGGRFQLLPLTKQFILNELDKSPQKVLLQGRWIEYFSRLSKKYSSEHWNWKDYDWLLAEGENILSIIDRAIVAEDEETTLLLTRAVLRYLDIKGLWSEMLYYGEKLYTIAQAKNDKNILAWICIYWLSWFYVEQGNIERAEILIERGFSIYKELGDMKGICAAMGNQARALRRSGNHKAAEELSERHLELARKYDYGDGIADAHNELGKLARDLKNWKKAKEHLEAVVEWCEKHEDEADLDSTFLIVAIGNLGWVDFQLGEHEKGKERILRSISFLEQMGGKGYITTLRLRLARVESALGHREKAYQIVTDVLLWAKRLKMERESQEAQLFLDEFEGV